MCCDDGYADDGAHDATIRDDVSMVLGWTMLIFFVGAWVDAAGIELFPW